MKSPIRELAILAALTCLCAVSPAFSADTQAPEGTILGMKSTSRPSALVYVDVRSGETHELLPGDACGPCFSPDGQSIAFVYKDMIYVAPRNDIEARRQLVPTKGCYNKHLSWADDGHIYFGEDKSIFRVDVRGGEKQKVVDMPRQMTDKRGRFGCLSVSNDATRVAWWGKTIQGGPGNESFSFEIADPEGTFRSYGKGCRSNVSPDGRFILKNSFENFHKEFYIFNFGTDQIVRTFSGAGVNYHKWPNTPDGQNYVLYMTTGKSLLMADVTTGDTWTILSPHKRTDIVNGFDYVAEPLSKVLSK